VLNLSRLFRRSPQAPKSGSPDRRFRPLVEQLEERRVLSTFTVANLNDSGAGSLRQDLLDANKTAAADVIDFQVAGTITLTSGALPAVTNPVTIDGTSAPGFATTPVVEVDANGFGGLSFNAGSAKSALKSLAIVNASGDAVTLNGKSISLFGNYIGLLPTGTPSGNAGNGLTINASSSGDTIGGSATGAGNVISANTGNGVAISGSVNNVLISNFIGTDPTGTKAYGNGSSGVLLTNGAKFNILGGTVSGEEAGTQPQNFKGTRPPEGNLISGNGRYGVLITNQSNFNLLEGNFIGTANSGLSALGNHLDGVAITNHSNNNSLEGTTQFLDPFIYYNVVSGNFGNGLRITDSDGTTIQADFFGLGSDDNTPVGNAGNGVVVEGTSANTTFGGRIPLGNCVAANGKNGVLVQGKATGFTSLNTFCGEGAFVTDTNLGNSLDGFLITATGGNNLIQVTQVDNSGRDGIEISGEASGVQVAVTIVGGFINGGAALPNHGNGVVVSGDAHGNLIGGSTTETTIGSHSVFSANDGYGVVFSGTAHNNQVNNTYIGTDVEGNAKGGILFGPGSYSNTVGSTNTNFPTVISGNDGDGIDMNGTKGNTVVATLIGLFPTLKGVQAKPNSGNGILIVNSSNNVIGGLAKGAGNIIANNGGNGVFVQSGQRDTIERNSIYDNTGLGIRVLNGANNNQAAPVLTSAVIMPRGIRATGTLTSTPNSKFTLELYAYGGQFYLGTMSVTTDKHGVASISFDGLPVGADDFVATATDSNGNTSAFSLGVLLSS
jgi:parallel beta-helix repeat protein